jgi:hypothetical protein
VCFVQTAANLSASGYGKGSSSSASMTPNIALVAPLPPARVRVSALRRFARCARSDSGYPRLRCTSSARADMSRGASGDGIGAIIPSVAGRRCCHRVIGAASGRARVQGWPPGILVLALAGLLVERVDDLDEKYDAVTPQGAACAILEGISVVVARFGTEGSEVPNPLAPTTFPQNFPKIDVSMPWIPGH